MATDFVMPKLAMAMNEGTINEWLVEDGEQVAKGQPIATVETEKVAYDVESPQAGFFRIIVSAGETVDVEVPIGVFADSALELTELADTSATRPPSGSTVSVPQEPEAGSPAMASAHSPARPASGAIQPLNTGRVVATPLAKKMAADRNLDLHYVRGTGPNGRIAKRDILRAESTGEGRPKTVSVSPGPPSGLVARARIPIAGTRATIANNMMEKMKNTATISQYTEVDVTDLFAIRNQFVAKMEQLGTKVSINAFFVKAIASAAKKWPIMNASMIDDEIVIWDNINVAVAITLPSGDGYTENLLVPVIRNAELLGVVEIDLEMKRLIAKAQEGTLDAADMADSTITFTTTAGIGPPGTGGSAILNGRNVSIVVIGEARKIPAEYNDEIRLRQIAPLCVSYDHRVVDGAPASRFLSHLWHCLQNPGFMLA